ncbi:MAG TPA: kelch repeat-containing protein [Candidatus Limnocylindrales bacterium]|nr:kelch repeat-containing protein [Candidatus Limnocylindrales bacterium]
MAITLACSTSTPTPVATATKSPPARGYHFVVGLGTNPGTYDSESGHVVMFGGGVDPRHFQNDTWIFDPSTNNWARA